MNRRFETRKQELLEDCQVAPEVFNGMLNRLEKFAEPFVEQLHRIEQKEHAQTYFQGLLSDLTKKNSEAIAYRHDQERMGLQLFIGSSQLCHHISPAGTLYGPARTVVMCNIVICTCLPGKAERHLSGRRF